jgi:hypothetical protein
MRRSALAIALVIWAVTGAAAQVHEAVLEGTVTDSTGLVVPGATVDLFDPLTNQHRTVTTDAAGTFRLPNISPGLYTLRVELAGFAPFTVNDLALAVGQTVRLMATLTPASLTTTVSVSGQPPALDVSQTAVATVIDVERIEELPVRSRNYLEFALLAPGVTRTQSSVRSNRGAALPDSGFSFGGLRPRSNTLTIDGVANNDEFTGGSRTELSLEMVREFQVVTSGWSAENGGASGGSINVVTKSGGNLIHGDAFLFAQSGILNASPPLEETLGEKPSLSRFRGGLAFGGPLVKDRTFYYAAAEQERTRDESASDIPVETRSIVDAALASPAWSKAGARQLHAGLFPTSLDETELSARVNHQLTSRHSLMARMAGTKTRESGGAFNDRGLFDRGARGSSSTTDVAFTATWIASLGTHMTNELRGQIATRRLSLFTTDTRGAGIVVPGVVEFGRPYAGNHRDSQRYVEAGDVVAWTRGRHFFKAGGNATAIHIDGVDGTGSGGLFVFRSIAALVAGQPEEFRQRFGSGALQMQAIRLGAFVQDRWTPHPALTVDAGVRLDGGRLPATVGARYAVLGPRLGVAWTPRSQWVVRGGAGIFPDRLPLASFAPAVVFNGRDGFEQIVDGPRAAAIFAATQGGPLDAPLTDISRSIYTARRSSWDSSSRQVRAGVERAFGPNTTASVNALFVRGDHLARTVNVNLLPPAVLTGDNAVSLGVTASTPQQTGRMVFGPNRRDPSVADVFEVQPTAASTYRGVTTTVNRRLANELEWSASYTWSRTRDNASDFDEQPENPFALDAEEAPSRYDQRHNLVASALFDLPIGEEDDRKPGQVPGLWARVFSNIEVANILSLGSGLPVNPVTGLDENRSHAFPFSSRPIGYGRNSLRSAATTNLDLRVLKFIRVPPHGRLDLVVEVFNVLNRTNVTVVNPVFGSGVRPSSGFGQPIEAAAPRQLQLSLDLEF